MNNSEFQALVKALVSGDIDEVRRISAEDSRQTREAAVRWDSKKRRESGL